MSMNLFCILFYWDRLKIKEKQLNLKQIELKPFIGQPFVGKLLIPSHIKEIASFELTVIAGKLITCQNNVTKRFFSFDVF